MTRYALPPYVWPSHSNELKGFLVLLAAGEARRCFHGVPRVLLCRHATIPLAAQALTAQQQPAAGNGPGSGNKMQGVFEHMATARLNVSVRQIVPRLPAAQLF